MDAAIAGIVVAAALVGVAFFSRYALLTALLDGLTALLILLPPALAGLWLVPLFRLGPLSWRWHLLLGSALGLGATSLLVLGLGLMAIPPRAFWIVLLIALAVAGVTRLRLLYESGLPAENAGRHASHDGRPGGLRFLWLLAAPFLALALVAASHPPGLIWQEEGFGYDVLEYHLQLPKEYVQNGRITYLPHNVYGGFPANVEMLYLLAMVVLDDVRDVGTVANTIHLFLAVLTVFAVWTTAREWSAKAAVISAVAVAVTGWLPYLSGLAYVENGLLFFEAAMLALVVRALRHRFSPPDDGQGARGSSPDAPYRWWFLAGVMGGLACGCKYTAAPMVVAPGVLVSFLIPRGSVHARALRSGALLGGALISFSPWLVKNLAMTGNPVFPLANQVFQAAPPGWGAEESDRWARGHRVAEEESDAGSRLRTAWTYLVADHYQRVGPLLLLVGPLGLFRRPRAATDAILGGMVFLQLFVWIGLTHLFARFAVILLVPLSLLAGRVWTAQASTQRKRVLVGCVILGACFNAYFAVLLQWEEGVTAVPAAAVYEGKIPGFEMLGTVNGELSDRAKVLLVGEAQPFYFARPVDYCIAFNRNPFLQTLRESSDPDTVLAWLRSRNYTHLLVHWDEVNRISGTYGFSPPLSNRQLAEAFERLSRVGLRPVRRFFYPGNRSPYAELYELPMANRISDD